MIVIHYEFIQIIRCLWPEVLYRCNGTIFLEFQCTGHKIYVILNNVPCSRIPSSIIKSQKVIWVTSMDPPADRFWFPAIEADLFGYLGHVFKCICFMLTAYQFKLVSNAACLSPPSFIRLRPHTGEWEMKFYSAS